MNRNGLQEMETFYMALADKTRLRLLNLMKNDEICVCFFTEVLGESQPKISRHLAYLRAAGLVEARRDGKWMHYSIKRPADGYGNRVLDSALEWLESREDLRKDREKYESVCCSPDALVQIAKSRIPFIYEQTDLYTDDPESPRSGHNELDEFLL
jgi:ArsR family transcriptional regulator, arsenate/arsenite/antimonite-responsive transcriptional repressor